MSGRGPVSPGGGRQLLLAVEPGGREETVGTGGAGAGRDGTALIDRAAAFGGARRRRGPFVLPGLGQRSAAPSDRLPCRMRPGVGLGAPMCAEDATSAVRRLRRSNGPLYTRVQTRGCWGPSV